MPLKTKVATSFMLSPPTNSVQASPPIGTYMMRLPNKFAAVFIQMEGKHRCKELTFHHKTKKTKKLTGKTAWKSYASGTFQQN